MSVKVAVRVRPFNQREKFLGCLCCIQMKEKTTILINPRDRSQKQHQFTFDYSFWSHDGFQQLENGYLYPIDDRFVDQKKIFKQLGQDILKNAWNGFNCCLFAYGQTGAGKSYSMIGYETNRGIVPMACQKIFQGIQRNKIKGKKQFELSISMLEIYNQKVQDLFIHTSKRPPNGLRIRESKKVGVYVQGITRYQVHSYAQIERRMQQGAKNRSLASTLMNQYSSRAHTIVMIEFIQKQFITQQKMNKKASLLNLVDLAGSQRVAKTGISDKDRLKQASQINKSLHTLGRVIQHLAQLASGKANVQIPYRQSALTRILETALGGNCVTTMICAVSPANDNYQQTLSTLRYADQTKKIKNKPIINESAVDKIIRELREENQRLKQMLRIAKLKGINLQQEDGNIFANIQQIQKQIRKNMQSFAINTDAMQQDDENITIREFVEVADPNDFYTGELSFDAPINTTATTLGNSKCNAFITNLSQDRLLSFKIKYSCQQQLYVGNKNLKEGGRNKLILCGLGVEDRHARLFQINQKYYIEPLSQQAGEYTLVNGRSVDKKTQIFHNDRIIFGTNSVFLFKNFNHKRNQKSPQKNLGSSQTKISKGGSGVGVGFGIGTDDLDQSLLIDWEDDQKNKPKNKLQKKVSRNSVSIETDTMQLSVSQQVDEKLLDYQFAINQRQNKMFQTSSSYSGSGFGSSNMLASMAVTNQMNNKLEEIEKQFQQLKRQNQRKMKQKQQQFRAQLKKIEIERQVEKAKLKQQLKQKQLEAKKINSQKQRIERIRDKLLEIEKERKQKQRMLRQSMLIGGDEQQQTQNKMQFQQVPSPQQAGNYSKKKGSVSIGQVNTVNQKQQDKHKAQDLASNQLQNKIQYIDRHHFHYEFNTVHNGGGNNKINDDFKLSDPSVNTTSANTILNNDQSMLLDQQALKRQSLKQSQLQAKKQKTRKNLKVQNVYNLNQTPPPASNEGEKGQKKLEPEQSQKVQRKRSLNMTQILYDALPPRSRRGSRKSSKSDQQQNLLNVTGEQILANYIPPSKISDRQERQRGSFENVSLNLSDDLTMHYAMRQEELLDKIKQYEQKLKLLQNSAQQKKQTIKNIRKSFVVDFGQNPNSDNFYSQEDLQLFQGQLDLSQIQTRKNSGELSESAQIERKIKTNMVQCQNQNIINQRTLQVRKRKREAQQLKQAFIKKQKRELQKKLVELIPMLQKFNLWAREMNRNLQGKAEIEYHNFTNYEIIHALKEPTQSKIGIQVKIYNFEQGRTYKWPIQVFKNRFELAENLFLRFLQNPSANLLSDKSKDPFWDPRDFQPFAVGYLTLECLSYQLDFQGEIALVYKENIVGYLDVVIQPTIDRKTKKLRQKLTQQSQNQNQICDPRQLLEQDLYFTISIQNFRPTQHLPIDKIQKYYIGYEILEQSYKSEQYKTQQINISKKRVQYMLRHCLHNVTEHTLAYLADSPICLTLNLLFKYDEQMSNMSSSFIQQSESSLNLSTMSEKLLKSEAGMSSGESPPPFSKKKSTTILQNPDVMSKIEKPFLTEQKKTRQRAETIQNQNSSSSKKKQKNKQDCSIF